MNIKTVMCKILNNKKKELKVTYTELEEDTGLSRSQLSYIFCHEGKGVSLDNIEILAESLGVEFAIEEIQKDGTDWCNS